MLKHPLNSNQKKKVNERKETAQRHGVWGGKWGQGDSCFQFLRGDFLFALIRPEKLGGAAHKDQRETNS